MIPQNIVDFIQEHKAVSICCLDGEGKPYCYTCYYAFLPEQGWLVYKSGFGTAHESFIQNRVEAAATIIPEQIEVATIRGVQIQGTHLADYLANTFIAAQMYYLRFPFAVAVLGKLFVLRLDVIKFTDNTRKFGYKEIWQRSLDEQQPVNKSPSIL